MSTSRAEILRNIRLALAKPALAQHDGQHEAAADTERLFRSASAKDHLVEKFQTEFELVSGEFIRAASNEEAVHSLCELIQSSGVRSVAISDHQICERLQLKEALQTALPEIQVIKESIDSESSYDRRHLKSTLSHFRLSVTGAEFLIAESGTIVVIAGTQASRQISLLPEIHVVLATPQQIYPNLAEAFQVIQKNGRSHPASAITLITGPSRTADIEKVLIKGVHGPTRIVTMMLES
jgi:L-lactate dehydrogenase complex protein LldG